MESAFLPTSFSASALTQLHPSFLAIVLPRILSHGRVVFRGLKCRHRQADAIQEMIGLAWRWHLRLAQKGKDATGFPTALAKYAARAVQCGSRLPGQDRINDVLSPLAQRRHHLAVCSLPEHETLSDNPVAEALADNTQSPPDEVACFKIDFTAWLGRLSQRDHCIVNDLMMGERTFDVATKYGVSPARISQLRRDYRQDWRISAATSRLTPRHPLLSELRKPGRNTTKNVTFDEFRLVFLVPADLDDSAAQALN